MGKTVRLFSYNQSLLALSRDIRKILTQDWHEADLRSSQLAIIARQWDIPYVRDFLDCKGSVWNYFYDELGIVGTPEQKAILKDALYSCIFGRKRHYALFDLGRRLKSPELSRKFFGCDLMQEIFQARDRQVKRVLDDGGAFNCYEEWLKTSEHNSVKVQQKTVDSILSQCAQAAEMKILAPVFELAATDSRFDILLFQHDGFCYVVDDRNRHRFYQDRMQTLVNSRCQELRVQSYLEFED